MEKVALIVAGGKGERMGSITPKQFLLLKNIPILMRTIKQFISFDKIIVVLPASQFNYWEKLCKETPFVDKHILVEGGGSRFESVKNGLSRITQQSIVAIHDGVRPLISKNLIDKLMAEVKKGTGVVPITTVTNSIREVKEGCSRHINRRNLYQVQTPQCFMFNDIKKAYQQKNSGFFTDDASVFESKGYKIATIFGEQKNIKITTKEDLKIAEAFMQ